MIREGIPVDPRCRAAALDFRTFFRAARALLEADEADAMPSFREAEQIRKNLRSTERVAHAIIRKI